MGRLCAGAVETFSATCILVCAFVAHSSFAERDPLSTSCVSNKKKRMNILSSAHRPHVSRSSITPSRPTQLLFCFSTFCVILSERFGDHTVLLCVCPWNGCALLAPLSSLGPFGSVCLNSVTPVVGECGRLRWRDPFFSLLLVWSVWDSVCVSLFWCGVWLAPLVWACFLSLLLV